MHLHSNSSRIESMFKLASIRLSVLLLVAFVVIQSLLLFFLWNRDSDCNGNKDRVHSTVTLRSDSTVGAAKSSQSLPIVQGNAEQPPQSLPIVQASAEQPPQSLPVVQANASLSLLQTSAPHPEFDALRRRGPLGSSTVFRLDCPSISDVSEVGEPWVESELAQGQNGSVSPCSGRQGVRRCHDVYSRARDGTYFRACQWRFPNGPCQEMRPEYREKLVRMSAKHNATNNFPNVRIAFRTRIFDARPWNAAPELCTRAEEIISCEFLSEDPRDGSIHGYLYHAMDAGNNNIMPDVQSEEWKTTPSFIYNWESPYNTLAGDSRLSRFHFRGDYRLDADISLNYFQWSHPRDGFIKQLIGQHENPFMHMFETKTGLFQPAVPFEQRYSDVAPVAWVASNCNSKNSREQVVQQLLDAGLKIDSMGGCLNNKKLPDDGGDNMGKNFLAFLSKYKFYLNFENSNCKHYYTEKLRRSLVMGIVPILLGHPADIDFILPHKDAAIKAWEFPNAAALAQYIKQAASDPVLFNKHIAWKSAKRENIGDKFWSYWSTLPSSGRYECGMCFMAYDIHLGKCAPRSDRKDSMRLAPLPPDTTCIPTDNNYWGVDIKSLDNPNLSH